MSALYGDTRDKVSTLQALKFCRNTNANERVAVRFGKIGGAEGDRTPDLMTASHALSQLSYGPINRFVTGNARVARSEATVKQDSCLVVLSLLPAF